MIEIKNVTLGYVKGKPLYNNLNLDIECGKITAIIAPFGSGKTTLLNALIGTMPTTSGHIKIGGDDTKSNKHLDKIAVMYQNYHFYNDISAKANAIFFALVEGVDVDNDKLELLFKEYELADYIDNKVGTFNHEMKRKLALLITALNDSPYILLDEPTTGISIEGKHKLWKKLRKLANEGKTIIVTASELHEVIDCDYVAQIKDGNLDSHTKFSNIS